MPSVAAVPTCTCDVCKSSTSGSCCHVAVEFLRAGIRCDNVGSSIAEEHRVIQTEIAHLKERTNKLEGQISQRKLEVRDLSTVKSQSFNRLTVIKYPIRSIRKKLLP